MELKKFILSELKAIAKNSLNESVTSVSGFTDAVGSDFSNFRQGKSKSELQNAEDKTITAIVSHFEGEFKNYLYKQLVSMVKRERVSVLKIISNYLANPNNSEYQNNIISLIGIPMLNFFLQKAFGKDSFWSRIKQITPFMKKVSTGNYALDTAIYTGLSGALQSGQVMTDFQNLAGGEIFGRINQIADDSDFNDIFLAEVLGINRGLRNVKRNIKAKAQNTVDAFKDLFVKREIRNKYKLVKEIMRYLPNLKRNIRGKIKDRIYDIPYQNIAAFFDSKGSNVKNNLDYISAQITPVIIGHLVENAQELYFEDFETDLSGIVKSVFLSPSVIERLKYAVKEIMTQAYNDLKAEEEKRKQQQIKSRYQK
jgi:hypothetical protein